MELDRKKFIGASEVAAVLGLSKWKSPLSLWAEKTGRIQNNLSEFEAVEWGTRLEEVVAKKFSQLHGVKLMAYKKRFVHPEHDFISCELDRIIVGTDEICEIKTCSAYMLKEWGKDDIPADYTCQVNLQMGLSGRDTAWIAVLCGGQKYFERQVKFDKEFYDKQIESCVHFWNEFVKKDVAPMACASDNDLLGDLYPQSKPLAVKLSSEFDYLIEERAGAIEAKKEAENACKEVEAKIKQALGDSEAGETEKYLVTWKTINKPEFTVKASSFRTMRCTEKK